MRWSVIGTRCGLFLQPLQVAVETFKSVCPASKPTLAVAVNGIVFGVAPQGSHAFPSLSMTATGAAGPAVTGAGAAVSRRSTTGARWGAV